MKTPRNIRNVAIFVVGLIAVAALTLVGIDSQGSGSSAYGHDLCVERQAPMVVATGPVPGGGGKKWTVTSGVESAKNCHGLLFTMKFRPVGTRRGSWSETRYEPPIGEPGPLPPGSPEIGAQDEVAPAGRVFSGYVSTNVTSVRVTFDDGSHLVVHPRGVGRTLLSEHPWLQEVRYFVQFYGGHRQVREVVLSGRLVGSPTRVPSSGAGEFMTG
jgi:hypothetical protein